MGKNKGRLRRIIKYFLSIFAYSKHIIIIGKISILPSRLEIHWVD